MTTIDQIKEAAIEAAAEAFCDAWDAGALRIESMRAAIDAYEAAMWRPIEEAPHGVSILVSGNAYGQPIVEQNVRSEGYGDFETVLSLSVEKPTHFRPIPQPPSR